MALEHTLKERYETFDEMNLSEDILRGIYANGFERPSVIQQIAIKPIIEGNDLIGQAQSGTGKTGTFSIALLQRINFKIIEPQAIVLCPTRELAIQTRKVINDLGEYCNVKCHICIGGQDVQADQEALRRGQHVIVGTPGRIYDMIKRKALKLDNLIQLVIDEADVMLEKGFKEQLYEIFTLGFPENMKIALFSATLTEQTYAIADKFMKNPLKITINNEEVNLSGINQYKICLTKDEHKLDTLMDLYKFLSIKQAIIYCNNKNKVISLAAELSTNQISMTYMHGEMTQDERNKIMSEFRNGKFRILITTDLLARGIDVQQVSLVINYDFPVNRENYIHRIGRTGRYGRKGVALNFVLERDEPAIREVETYYKLAIGELPDNLNGIFDV